LVSWLDDGGEEVEDTEDLEAVFDEDVGWKEDIC
jgi:hypothetical protein